eukprot:gb/GECG01005306.1/.p1 GENE.gb/GECG01005306.1/~~gb/GECG01005306.1/.p1  ORF type:complete len:1069 (+),score=106.25 gb/GECG01005306.1/:1-3207(+)
MSALSGVDWGIVGACTLLVVVLFVLLLRWQCLLGWCCDPKTRHLWNQQRRLDKILKTTNSAAAECVEKGASYANLLTELFEPAPPAAVEALQSAVPTRAVDEGMSWAEQPYPPLRTVPLGGDISALPPCRRIHPEHIRRVSRYAIDTDDGRLFVVVKRRTVALTLKREGLVTTTGEVVDSSEAQGINRLVSLLQDESSGSMSDVKHDEGVRNSRSSSTGTHGEDLEVLSLRSKGYKTRMRLWKAVLSVGSHGRRKTSTSSRASEKSGYQNAVWDKFPALQADIERCGAYSSGEKKDALSDLLSLFLWENPQYTYWQNLATIAAVVLQVCNDEVEDAIDILQAIAASHLRGHLFSGGLHYIAEARLMQAVNHTLAFWDPLLATHLGRLGLETSLYANRWMTLLWTDVLPPSQCMILWDLLFSTDARLSCFVAVALLMHYRQALFQCGPNEGLVVVSKLRVDGIESNWSSIVRHALWLWANSPSTLGETECGPLDEVHLLPSWTPQRYVSLSRSAMDYSLILGMLRENSRLLEPATEPLHDQDGSMNGSQIHVNNASGGLRSLPTKKGNLIRSWAHRPLAAYQGARDVEAAASVPANRTLSPIFHGSSPTRTGIELPSHSLNDSYSWFSPTSHTEKKRKKLQNYVEATARSFDLHHTHTVRLGLTLPALVYSCTSFGARLLKDAERRLQVSDPLSLLETLPVVTMDGSTPRASLRDSSQLILDIYSSSVTDSANVLLRGSDDHHYNVFLDTSIASLVMNTSPAQQLKKPLHYTAVTSLANALTVYDLRIKSIVPVIEWQWIVASFGGNLDYVTVVKPRTLNSSRGANEHQHVTVETLLLPQDVVQQAEEQVQMDISERTGMRMGSSTKQSEKRNFKWASCHAQHLSDMEVELQESYVNDPTNSPTTALAPKLDTMTNTLCASVTIDNEYRYMLELAQEEGTQSKLASDANQSLEVSGGNIEATPELIITDDIEENLLESGSKTTVDDMSAVEVSANTGYYNPWSIEELWIRETHPNLWKRKDTLCLLLSGDLSLIKSGRDMLVRAGFSSVAALSFSEMVKVSPASTSVPG